MQMSAASYAKSARIAIPVANARFVITAGIPKIPGTALLAANVIDVKIVRSVSIAILQKIARDAPNVLYASDASAVKNADDAKTAFLAQTAGDVAIANHVLTA
jgi:hypothetical protein